MRRGRESGGEARCVAARRRKALESSPRVCVRAAGAFPLPRGLLWCGRTTVTPFTYRRTSGLVPSPLPIRVKGGVSF